MNILIIEDQKDWIKDVADAAGDLVKIYSPEETGLLVRLSEEGGPAEEQLVALLLGALSKYSIDLVLLDTDLSRAQGELQAQSGYQVALQEIGIPVCRYQKGGTETKFGWWQRLQRIAVDGAAAIWVSKEMVSGDDFDRLVPWLNQMAKGFKLLTEKLDANPDLLKDGNGPADVLAVLLDKPDAKVDFSGYSAQNFFFFAPQQQTAESESYPSRSRRYATKLGYWLYNYILTFPGPILSAPAAAAFLNLEEESFHEVAVQKLIEGARYHGPFGDIDSYYWRDALVGIVDDLDGDIGNAPSLSDLALERVDKDDPSAEAFLCILSNEPTLSKEAASNPDWIPPGAYQTRIKQERLDELGPLLGI